VGKPFDSVFVFTNTSLMAIAIGQIESM